jgi:SPFH domain / Band 7 family
LREAVRQTLCKLTDPAPGRLVPIINMSGLPAGLLSETATTVLKQFPCLLDETDWLPFFCFYFNLHVMSTIIRKGTLGFIYKDGELDRVLPPGKHSTGFAKVEVVDCSYPFNLTIPLSILLQHPDMPAHLNVAEVTDNQIALHFEDGVFKNILGPGRHAFWNALVKHEFEVYDISDADIPDRLNRQLFAKPELANYIRKMTVESYEQALLFRNNQFTKMLSPGDYYFWKNAETITIFRLDMRRQQLEVNGQEILTKDKANIRLNFIGFFKVTDPLKIGLEIKEYKEQLYQYLQLALREYIGGLSFDELLANKDQIGKVVLEQIKDKAVALGVEVMDAGVKDIILPGEIKDIMNQVLIAEKRAQANIITRREETASTRSLMNTAKLMEENAVLFKLKELEYVERLTEKISQINLSGGGSVLEQLKGLLLSGKS